MTPIFYFQNSTQNVLGSTNKYFNATMTVNTDTNMPVLNFSLPSANDCSAYMVNGNFVTFKFMNKVYKFQIVTPEYSDDGYFTAKANSMPYELSNKKAVSQTAPNTAQPINWYIGQTLQNTGWTIGRNELPSSTIHKLAFTDDSTVIGRLYAIATQFSCELDFRVVLDGWRVAAKYIDIVHQLGSVRNNVMLSYGDNVSNIQKTVDTSSLVTALTATGSSDDINLKGINYKSSDGSFISPAGDGTIYYQSKSNALGLAGNYLVGTYQDETAKTPQALITSAENELKKQSDPVTTIETTVAAVPNDLHVGDTLRLISNNPEHAERLSTRIVEIDYCLDDETKTVLKFGDYSALKPGSNLWDLIQLKQQVGKLNKNQIAASIKATVLKPDGDDFAHGDPNKRLILQAWRGNANYSAYLDSKGFEWHKVVNGVVDPSYQRTGYLLQVGSGDVGTIRGQVETDYIQDSTEINPNKVSISQLAKNVVSDTNPVTSATEQSCHVLTDGTFLTSHASGNDTIYCHWKSDLSTMIDSMTVTNGGHGASFGIEYINSVANIWVVTKDTSGNYRVSRFPYQGGKTISSTDSSVSAFLTFSSGDYIRVNYDDASNYVGITRTNGDYEVLKKADVVAGKHNVFYKVNMFNYGFNATLQTFQSSLLLFPYLYWWSGDYDMHDTRTMYCVNVIHQGQCFKWLLNLSTEFGINEPTAEAEAISPFNGKLLLGFNLYDDGHTNHKQGYYTVPLITRPAASTIDNGEILESENARN